VNAQQGGGGFPTRLPVREPRGPFTPEQIQIAIDSGRAVLLANVRWNTTSAPQLVAR